MTRHNGSSGRYPLDHRPAEIKEHERLSGVIFVALLNPKGDYLEVNRAALEDAGHKIEEIRGKPFWTARWWQVSEQIKQDLQAAIRRAATGEFVRYEMDIFDDQSRRLPITIDFSLRPIRGESGEVEYLLAEGRNITERKRAEEEVARQAQELRVLNEQLKELDRLKTQFSPNVSHEFRTPMPHGECPMVVAIKEGHAVRGAEAVAERPDGKPIWFESYPPPLRDSAGRVVGGINMLLDVTERKRAEEALHHRSEQYETLLNQAPLGVYLVDADFRIRMVNSVALSIFGDVPDLIGREFDEVIHTIWTKEYADEIVRVFRNTLETGDPYFTPERAEFRVDRGVVEYYEWRLDRILLLDGRHGVVCYVRDISGQVQARETIRESEERYRELARENRRLYEQEQRAREAAESATRAKDEFLAIVSHELRAPLTAILGYNNLLREETPDAERLKSSCDVIERNVKTQLRLIEDLLDNASIARGKLRLELGAVNINSVIADAIDVVRHAAEAKGICLRVVEEDGSGREESSPPNPNPAIVRGDAVRLQQIIWNLLSNAIKFTRAGGRVELRTERAEGHIRIIVSDTGDGIPPEFLPHVFDRFRQADQSGPQRYGGLGLGLSLVKHLVELHGGEVEAASQGAGHGSTFIVTLPLVTESELVAVDPRALALAPEIDGEAHAQGPILSPSEVAIAGLRILVVDDQEDARALLTQFLGRHGAVVMTASSGAEGLAILSDPPGGMRPDILLCDIAMPEEDGYAALRRMRALEASRGVAASQRIPAVALTALTGNENRLRAMSSGFQMHVAKPADQAELIIVIENLAGMQRRETESI
jgi:PAS domain S-box-containing protein